MADNEDFASLFEQFEKAGSNKREPRVGDTVRGTVISIQGESIFIDLGAKTEGVVDVEELTGEDGGLTVAIGDTIDIVVSGRDEASGTLLLGAKHARRIHGQAGTRRHQF